MTPLRVFWDQDKMLFADASNLEPRGQRSHPSESSLESTRKLTSIIHSPFFWSYTFMVRALQSLVKDFELYCYSCNCHPERTAKFYSTDDQISCSRLVNLLQGQSCCMMGRLTQNFAAGERKEKFQTFANARSSAVLEHCCALTPAERARVVTDFSKGHSKLYVVMQVKFACYDNLPHHLSGRVRDDEAVGRACARRRLDLLEETLRDRGLDPFSASARKRLHPLVVAVLLDLGPHFRDFAAGRKELAAAPDLLAHLGRLRFATVLEIAVEPSTL